MNLESLSTLSTLNMDTIKTPFISLFSEKTKKPHQRFCEVLKQKTSFINVFTKRVSVKSPAIINS